MSAADTTTINDLYSLVLRDAQARTAYKLTASKGGSPSDALDEVTNWVRLCGHKELTGTLTWMAKDMFPLILSRGRLLTTLDTYTMLEYLMQQRETHTWTLLDPHGAVVSLQQLFTSFKIVPAIPAHTDDIGAVEWAYWQELVDNDPRFKGLPRYDKSDFLRYIDAFLTVAIFRK